MWDEVGGAGPAGRGEGHVKGAGGVDEETGGGGLAGCKSMSGEEGRRGARGGNGGSTYSTSSSPTPCASNTA